jgi:hypothetical protein
MVSILRSASLISKSDSWAIGRGMDAPLRLGRRHTLNPMDPALELEPGENAAARNFGDDLLEPPRRPLAGRQNFDLPALALGVFDIHAKEIAGEESCFIPARSRPDLEDCAAFVSRVLGQEGNLNRFGHPVRFHLGRSKLIVRHCPHIGVEIGLPQHRLEVSPLLFFGLEGLNRGDHRLEFVEFARQCRILRTSCPLGEARGDLLVTTEDEIEVVVGHV